MSGTPFLGILTMNSVYSSLFCYPLQSFQELPNMRAALKRSEEDNYFELDISNLKSDLNKEEQVCETLDTRHLGRTELSHAPEHKCLNLTNAHNPPHTFWCCGFLRGIAG